MTTQDKVIESGALPSDVSAQKTELTALTQALELSEGKWVNIWINSKYAFGVIHAHGAMWKEKELLTAQRTSIKHSKQILTLLEGV